MLIEIVSAPVLDSGSTKMIVYESVERDVLAMILDRFRVPIYSIEFFLVYYY